MTTRVSIPAIAAATLVLLSFQPTSAAKKRKTKKRVKPIPLNVDMIPVTRRDVKNLRLSSRTSAQRGRRLSSRSLDQLIVDELVREGMDSATRAAADDILVRRMYLDAIGKLPTPEEMRRYLASSDPERREKLIEELLARPEFGENLARYWRDVIDYNLPQGTVRINPTPFVEWLADQFNQNRPWNEIVDKMITATGLHDEVPETYFIVAHNADPVQLAGETSRIFLGIHIQCAECHDHPSDFWKREQFHEFASFFARSRVKNRRDLETKTRRPVREVYVTKRPYRMPDLKDPSAQGETMAPVFLSGQAIRENASDADRRRVLSGLLSSRRNYYFSKAFVNRVWHELMGYGFTNPVDNLGSEVTVAYPRVFETLASTFRETDYDVKELYRIIMGTKTYERRFREIDGSFGEDVMFAAIQPTRLSADQIYDCTAGILGTLDKGPRYRRYGRQYGVLGQFQEAFGFDPSANHEDLEGSIPQALLLMNNAAINGRISASKKGSLLAKLLANHKDDVSVMETLYLQVLGRQPRDSEFAEFKAYAKKVKNRKEAFEDLLWCLLNSTEYLYNH